MSDPVSFELLDRFCSYCGHPPQRTLQGSRRVCIRCKLGIMLSAPQGHAPRPLDPFLIVDEQLFVQAISQRAEHALGIDETAGIHEPLGELLQPVSGRLDRIDVAVVVGLAADGFPPPEELELSAVEEPRRRFKARAVSCGDPPAALLILAPLAATENGSINGASHNGHHQPSAGRSPHTSRAATAVDG